MTEPVAYRVDGTIYNDIKDAEYAVRETEHLRNELGMDNGLIRNPVYIEPLYTSEQIHPRVKMTQAEFDEWKCLYENTIEISLTAYRVLNEILDSTHNSRGKYIELSKRVYQENDSMTISEKQAELTDLFINYSPDNPEETIEIIPNMKWFVVAKEPSSNGKYSAITILDIDDVYGIYGMYDYDKISSNAYQFDTQEEAERWVNPLTEVVSLPVGED